MAVDEYCGLHAFAALTSLPDGAGAGQLHGAGLYCVVIAPAAPPMKFEHHAFISYAHIDDQPLSPDQRGWVTRFHATLQALLSMRIGSQAQIWRDDRLHGNEIFPEEIIDQFSRTAMLISVLTPRYVESDWCSRELRVFCEEAEKAGGLRLDNRCRVFKVLKLPLPEGEALPQPMQDMIGYPFFVVEEGAPIELDAAYGETYGQDYNRRVCKLAWDIAQLLRELEGMEAPAAPTTPRLTVYLAECSHDCRPARERIEAELRCHGHTVLPDQRIDCSDEEACTRQVADWLAHADLAVHLVGRSGGAVPDGARGEPLVVLQNRMAAERSESTGLPRLIWLPTETRSAQPTHQAFIDALHSEAALQRGADLLSAGLDGFVQTLHSTIERLTRPPTTPAAPAVPADAPPGGDATAGNGASIYLLCTSADRKPSVALRRWLRDHGVDVELPAFEGSAAEVRSGNRERLAGCDAVIVYYGAGDEAWKRGVDAELKKQRGLGDGAAPRLQFTYLDAPSSGDKDDLIEMQEPDVVDGRGGLPEAELLALLARLPAVQASP